MGSLSPTCSSPSLCLHACMCACHMSFYPPILPPHMQYSVGHTELQPCKLQMNKEQRWIIECYTRNYTGCLNSHWAISCISKKLTGIHNR